MKRSDLLRTRPASTLDAIAICRDIVEGNYRASDAETIELVELMARIFTDFEILAINQQFERDCDPGDER